MGGYFDSMEKNEFSRFSQGRFDREGSERNPESPLVIKNLNFLSSHETPPEELLSKTGPVQGHNTLSPYQLQAKLDDSDIKTQTNIANINRLGMLSPCIQLNQARIEDDKFENSQGIFDSMSVGRSTAQYNDIQRKESGSSLGKEFRTETHQQDDNSSANSFDMNQHMIITEEEEDANFLDTINNKDHQEDGISQS